MIKILHTMKILKYYETKDYTIKSVYKQIISNTNVYFGYTIMSMIVTSI